MFDVPEANKLFIRQGGYLFPGGIKPLVLATLCTGYPWVCYTCSLFLLVDELLERCLVFGTVQSCMHVLFCKPQVKQLRTENVVATEGTLRTAHAT